MGGTMHKKMHQMAIFIEFVAGSGLAIFFHTILHHEEAAFLIFGVGLLLSLATFLLREDLSQTRERLMDRYDQAHDITFTIAQITDPECRDKAQEILAGTQRTLGLLLQGYVPLDETEFYLKGTKYFSESTRRVLSVDPVTLGWGSRGALVNYYQANLLALERGVQITRIFVLNREEQGDPEIQKILLQQKRDGIDVRIAYREELPVPSDISGRDTTSSFDFAIYDDLVATEVFNQPGKYFGRKTRSPALVGNYLHLFDLIRHGSHAITVEQDRVCLSAELLPLAS
jgi:hypothetical protein